MRLTHIRRPRPYMSIWLYSINMAEVVVLFVAGAGKVSDCDIINNAGRERGASEALACE